MFKETIIPVVHDQIRPALIHNALHGAIYRSMTAEDALRNKIVFYSIGGVIAPFIAIKIIDILLVLLGVG
jgi:K+-transporting ATPase ATPase B chain